MIRIGSGYLKWQYSIWALSTTQIKHEHENSIDAPNEKDNYHCDYFFTIKSSIMPVYYFQ